MKTFYKTLFLLLFTVLLSNCAKDNSQLTTLENNSRPENLITYKEMAGMFHQYDTGQKKVLDKYRATFTGNKNDTVESVSHFYELEDLKQYIRYLEKLSNEKQINLTGIRIFSAAYPKDYADKELRGRQTLVFMPTSQIGSRNDVAFEPLYSEIGKPIKFTEFLHKYTSKDTRQVMRASFLPFLATAQDDLESSGANRLMPSPPY